MTHQELSRHFQLANEIAMLERQLEEMNENATSMTSQMSGMPRGSKHADKTSLAGDIADLTVRIRELYAELEVERQKLEDYIATIDYSLVRRIVRYRHVEHLLWSQIAYRIGGKYTPEQVRNLSRMWLRRH